MTKPILTEEQIHERMTAIDEAIDAKEWGKVEKLWKSLWSLRNK